MRHMVFLAIVVASFFTLCGKAQAVLCGGDHVPPNRQPLIQVVSRTKDAAGNIFTVRCVNREFFQGVVFVKATGKTVPFARCVFPWGANVRNIEYDDQGNFQDIEWVNVKPPQANAASRNDVVSALENDENIETGPWLRQVGLYLLDHQLEGEENSRFYSFPFSPNDQDIGFFLDANIDIAYTLTPDMAIQDYNLDGSSPLPILNIDPAMTLPGASYQGANVPEPDTAGLLLVAVLFSGAAAKLRKR